MLQTVKPLKHKKIVVVGAGIAGLTFTIGFYKNAKRLHEMKGINNSNYIMPEILIVERRSKDKLHQKTPGSGIGLWGPALLALDRLQLSEEINQISKPLQYAGYRSYDGSWIVRPPPLFSSNQSLYEKELKQFKGCRTLTREDFHNILLSEIEKYENESKRQILYTNTSVSNIEVINEEDVIVHLENGEVITSDICIGADGIHSFVRKTLYGSQIEPKYSGYAYYRANVDVRSLPQSNSNEEECDSLENLAFEAWGSKGRYGVVPLPNRSLFWFAAVEEKPIPKIIEGNKTTYRDVQYGVSSDKKEELINFFSKVKWMDGISGPLEMIKNTKDEDILRTEIYDLSLPESQWVHQSKRVILIGDAAHAVSPNLAQGAMLSIQDSLFLAPLLANLYNDQSRIRLSNIITNYITTRRRASERTRIWSKMVSISGQFRFPLLQLRNLSMKLFPSPIKNWFFDQLHRYLLGWNYRPQSLGYSLWESLLPPRHFNNLPNDLKRILSTYEREEIEVRGTVTSYSPSTLFSKLFAKLSQLPPPGSNLPYKLKITRKEGETEELWESEIGAHRHYEYQKLMGNVQYMRKGPGLFSKYLPVEFYMKILPWSGTMNDFNEENDGDAEATGMQVDIVKADFLVPLINLPIPLPGFCLPKVKALIGGKRGQESGYKMRISVDLPMNLGNVFKYDVDVQ